MLNLEFKKNCFCSANGFDDLKNKKYFLVKHFEGSKGGCGLWHHVWKTSKEDADKDIEDRKGELYIAFFDVENKEKIKARIKENKARYKRAAKLVEDFCGGKVRTKKDTLEFFKQNIKIFETDAYNCNFCIREGKYGEFYTYCPHWTEAKGIMLKVPNFGLIKC